MLISLIALAVFILPRVMVTGLEDAADRFAAENDIRGTHLQGLTGLFFLTTAFFTWCQLRVARTRLTTDRFTRAIDQIGHRSTFDEFFALIQGERRSLRPW